MRKVMIPAALLLVALQAQARCDVREYAQYKDMLARKEGRTSVALLYCLNKSLGDIRPGTQESRECRGEQTKILDALGSVRAKSPGRLATATIKWAAEGCNGMPPK
jgi:hypothetical protein